MEGAATAGGVDRAAQSAHTRRFVLFSRPQVRHIFIGFLEPSVSLFSICSPLPKEDAAKCYKEI
jgi:hypothetical protein